MTEQLSELDRLSLRDMLTVSTSASSSIKNLIAKLENSRWSSWLLPSLRSSGMSLAAMAAVASTLLDMGEEPDSGMESTTTGEHSGAPATEFTTPIIPRSLRPDRTIQRNGPAGQSLESALVEVMKENPLAAFSWSEWIAAQAAQGTGSTSQRPSTLHSVPVQEESALGSLEWLQMVERWRHDTNRRMERVEAYLRMEDGIFT